MSHSSSNDDLHARLATAAWLKIDPAQRNPAHITPLYASKIANKKNRAKRKSSVYRLDGGDLALNAVVAKRCTRHTAEVENLIYEKLLPDLSISILRYYGRATVQDVDWIFLEYADGVEWRETDPVHTKLAAEWLAHMHSRAAGMDILSLLPDRGPSYYRSQLQKARLELSESHANSALAPADRSTIDRFLALSDIIDSHFPEVYTFCETIPETLVHNDFVGKNVHVQQGATGLTLLPFDWELSGRGVPAVDLHWMFLKPPAGAIQHYVRNTEGPAARLGIEDFEQLSKVGALFRMMDASEWASSYLRTHAPTKAIDYLRRYACYLEQIFDGLAWR